MAYTKMRVVITEVGERDWFYKFRNAAVGKTGCFHNGGKYHSFIIRDGQFYRGEFFFDTPVMLPDRGSPRGTSIYESFNFIQIKYDRLEDESNDEYVEDEYIEEEYIDEYEDEEEQEHEEDDDEEDGVPF